ITLQSDAVHLPIDGGDIAVAAAADQRKPLAFGVTEAGKQHLAVMRVFQQAMAPDGKGIGERMRGSAIDREEFAPGHAHARHKPCPELHLGPAPIVAKIAAGARAQQGYGGIESIGECEEARHLAYARGGSYIRMAALEFY